MHPPDNRLNRPAPGDFVAWRLGVVSGAAVAALCFVYLVVLVIGLATLPSPDHPVQQPWFALLELLILFIAPAMVALAVAVCCSASPGRWPIVPVEGAWALAPATAVLRKRNGWD